VNRPDALSPAKRALLERALRERRAAAPQTGIPRRTTSGPAPLSFAQQRMWFLQQWQPQAPTFNGARAFRLRGELDRSALEQALARIIERHESLRTVIDPGPEPVQRVLAEWQFTLAVRRLAAPEAVEPLLRELAREPFDLAADLMLRADLIELGDADHVLLVRMHHIAADAHSDRVLFDELAALYDARRAGRDAVLAPLGIQYADYAVWQRAQLQGERLNALVAYWAAQLDGAPALLRLPTDRSRPAVQRHDGAHHALILPHSLGADLLALGREEGATFFMTMLAAFCTLLYRISGQEDVVLGSPIANRNNLELAGMIGFFTNTIALRVGLAGNPSFREVLRRARHTALGAYAHQELPFEKVVEAVAPKRDASYNPIFQVNFRAQESQRPALRLTGIEAEPITVDIGFSRFDLALELELRADALTGYFEYDHDLFEAASVAALEADLSAMLVQIVQDPDLPVLALRVAPRRRAAAPTAATIIKRQNRMGG
jgi:hypothetical protein